jgi:hypothetical protein
MDVLLLGFGSLRALVAKCLRRSKAKQIHAQSLILSMAPGQSARGVGVPRASLRFALGYLLMPLWGCGRMTPSGGRFPRVLVPAVQHD